jgi:hypothetical protein
MDAETPSAENKQLKVTDETNTCTRLACLLK